MPYFEFIWPPGTIDHLDEHGVSQADFEYVVTQPERVEFSRTSGLPAVRGHTPDGRYIFAVYRIIDDVTIEPVTAYEIEE
ncbi:MAG: hypothetical protein WD851_15315 [Pirellulales bacterium]